MTSLSQIDLEPEGKVYVVIDLSGSSSEGENSAHSSLFVTQNVLLCNHCRSFQSNLSFSVCGLSVDENRIMFLSLQSLANASCYRLPLILCLKNNVAPLKTHNFHENLTRAFSHAAAFAKCKDMSHRCIIFIYLEIEIQNLFFKGILSV